MKYKVTTPPEVEPITRQQAKAHLRVEMDFYDDDDLIDDLIKAGRQWAENYLQRALVEQTITAKFEAFSSRMELPMTNLISVTSVKYQDTNDATQTVATTVYGVDTFSDNGAIYLKDSQDWPSPVLDDPLAVEVIYKAGYASDGASPPDYLVNIPEDIRRGILLLIGHLYENRETSIIGTVANELPMGAREILYPYRRLGV